MGAHRWSRTIYRLYDQQIISLPVWCEGVVGELMADRTVDVRQQTVNLVIADDPDGSIAYAPRRTKSGG